MKGEDSIKIFSVVFLMLIQSCTSLFYQPSQRQFVEPETLNLSYEDVYFTSKDGTRLHGWFFKAKNTPVKGTVIQFHGNAENLSSHFLSLIWLVEHGYNLFTWDYRGYGKSEGKPDPEGVHEDGLAALAQGLKLQQQHGQGHYVVYGQSLGGTIVLRALPEFKANQKVTFLVQDSSFASYQDIAFNKMASNWFTILLSPLTYILISDKYASNKVFNKIIWPTLVIAGEDDEIIPSKFGKEIYDGIATDEKWFWKIPEATHIDAFLVEEGKYRQPFLELLDRFRPE